MKKKRLLSVVELSRFKKWVNGASVIGRGSYYDRFMKEAY